MSRIIDAKLHADGSIAVKIVKPDETLHRALIVPVQDHAAILARIDAHLIKRGASPIENPEAVTALAASITPEHKATYTDAVTRMVPQRAALARSPDFIVNLKG